MPDASGTALRYRIGFDIGGTFTDFILHDGSSGAIRLHKCLTTPDDPSRGALEGASEQRYDIYDLCLQFPAPLVPRSRRLEIDERVLADGATDFVAEREPERFGAIPQRQIVP